MKTILFQTGGPFHPVEAQAKLIQSWLPSDWKIKPAFGTEAFEQLANADLYVAGGLHWTVLSDLSALIGSDPEPPIWESAQIEKHPYIPRQPSCISHVTNRRSDAIVLTYRFRTRMIPFGRDRQ
jgi:hypothetical protein